MMNVQRFAVPAQGKVVKSLNAFSLPESNLVAMTSEGIEFDVSGYNTDRLLFVARNDNASTAVTALKVKAGDGYAAGRMSTQLCACLSRPFTNLTVPRLSPPCRSPLPRISQPTQCAQRLLS